MGETRLMAWQVTGGEEMTLEHVGVPQSQEDLGDDLCKYCPLDENHRGTHGTPNGYYSCEGRSCNDAYEAYLDEIAPETDDCSLCRKWRPLAYKYTDNNGRVSHLCEECAKAIQQLNDKE